MTALLINGHRFTLYSHSYLGYGLEVCCSCPAFIHTIVCSSCPFVQAAQELFQHHHMDAIEQDGNPCYPRNNRHSAIGSFEKCAEMIGSLPAYVCCHFLAVFIV